MFNSRLDRRVQRMKRAGTGEVNERLGLLCGMGDNPPFHSLWASVLNT